MKRPVVIVHPLTDTLSNLLEATRAIAEEENYEIFEVEDLVEINQLLPTLGPSLTFMATPKKCAQTLLANTKFLKKSSSKIILISNKKLPPKTLEKLTKLGLTEFIQEPVAPKTLLYKLKLQIRSLPFGENNDDEEEEVRSFKAEKNQNTISNDEAQRVEKGILTGSEDEGIHDKTKDKKTQLVFDKSETEEEEKEKSNLNKIDNFYRNKDKKDTKLEFGEENTNNTKERFDDSHLEAYYKTQRDTGGITLEFEKEKKKNSNQGPVDYSKDDMMAKAIEEIKLQMQNEGKLSNSGDNLDDHKDNELRSKKDSQELILENEKNNKKEINAQEFDLFDEDKKDLSSKLALEEGKNKSKNKDKAEELELTDEEKSLTKLELENARLKEKKEASDKLELTNDLEKNKDKKNLDNLELSDEKKKNKSDLEKLQLDDEKRRKEKETHELDLINDIEKDLEKAQAQLNFEDEKGQKDVDALEIEDASKKNKKDKTAELILQDEHAKKRNDKNELDLTDENSSKNKHESHLKLDDGENKKKNDLENKLKLEESEKKKSEKDKDKDKGKLNQREVQNTQIKLSEDKKENKKNDIKNDKLENRMVGKTQKGLELEDADGKKIGKGNVEHIQTHYGRKSDKKNPFYDWDMKKEKSQTLNYKDDQKKKESDFQLDKKERKDLGEQTIDYEKMKKEFESLNIAQAGKKRQSDFQDESNIDNEIKGHFEVFDEPVADLEVEENGEAKESTAESETVFEPETRGLEYAVKVLNLYYKKDLKEHELFKFVQQSVYDESRGVTTFFEKVDDEKEPFIELFNGHTSMAHFLTNENKFAWWSKMRDENYDKWISYNLPKWKDETFQEVNNKFFYPYVEGNKIIGFSVVDFEKIVMKKDANKIEVILETARGVYLEHLRLKGIEGSYEAENKEKKEEKKKKGFIGKLFGRAS